MGGGIGRGIGVGMGERLGKKWEKIYEKEWEKKWVKDCKNWQILSVKNIIKYDCCERRRANTGHN